MGDDTKTEPDASYAETTAMKEATELLQLRRRDHEIAYRKRKWREKLSLQPISNVLTSLFKDKPHVLKKMDEGAAIMAWKEVVGETTAAFSEAIRFRGNTLVVQVSDAIWMQQLSLLKTSLLRRYQQQFPALKIKDIYFTRTGRG